MPTRPLGSLGAMVRKKRGDAKLRDTAKEIGISPATLMRVESGRIPDVTTFGKLCHWLKVDPGSFLGFVSEEASPSTLLVSAHMRVDQNPKPETVNALAKMILLATRGQKGTINEDS